MSELKHIIALRDALATMHDQVSLPQLTCLLAITAEPGLSVNELADRTGLPQATASRHVSTLLGRYQDVDQKVPTALISQQISRENPRRRSLHVTTAGRDLLAVILRPSPSANT